MSTAGAVMEGAVAVRAPHRQREATSKASKRNLAEFIAVALTECLALAERLKVVLSIDEKSQIRAPDRT